MIKRIEITNPQSPLSTATAVMKYRNEKKPLTEEFCISVLEKSDNASVSYKLLELIKAHIEQNPQSLNQYAPIMSELWFRSIKNKKNTELLAQIVQDNIEHVTIGTDTTMLIYLLSTSENLPKEKKDELRGYLRQILPLSKEQTDLLQEEILINKVKQAAYKDIKTEIVPKAKLRPQGLYRVQQELLKEDKLEYNTAYGQEWDYCALGLIGDENLTSEEYQQITNVPNSLKKQYPQSILREMDNINTKSGFADEKRVQVLENVKLLEETKDFPYLQNPKLCYDVLFYISVFLSNGAVNRSQMLHDGTAKEFSAVFSRLLHLYNCDKQKLDEKEYTQLALLLESHCGRKMQDMDFQQAYKEYSYFLSRDDLIVLTYPYAIEKGILSDGLSEKMHVNVFQLDKRPLDYLPQIKTAKEKYLFLKGFRVHSDEEEMIDVFPELALEDISKHEYYRHQDIKTGTGNLLQTAKANMSIINKSYEEGQGIPEDKEKNLLVATIGALMDRYAELKARQEEEAAEDIYEQILVFCADTKHQLSRISTTPNSAYISMIYAKKHPDIKDLAFKTPKECREILEEFRNKRIKRREQEKAESQQKSQSTKTNTGILQKMKNKLFGRG